MHFSRWSLQPQLHWAFRSLKALGSPAVERGTCTGHCVSLGHFIAALAVMSDEGLFYCCQRDQNQGIGLKIPHWSYFQFQNPRFLNDSETGGRKRHQAGLTATCSLFELAPWAKLAHRFCAQHWRGGTCNRQAMIPFVQLVPPTIILETQFESFCKFYFDLNILDRTYLRRLEHSTGSVANDLPFAHKLAFKYIWLVQDAN